MARKPAQARARHSTVRHDTGQQFTKGTCATVLAESRSDGRTGDLVLPQGLTSSCPQRNCCAGQPDALVRRKKHARCSESSASTDSIISLARVKGMGTHPSARDTHALRKVSNDPTTTRTMRCERQRRTPSNQPMLHLGVSRQAHGLVRHHHITITHHTDKRKHIPIRRQRLAVRALPAACMIDTSCHGAYTFSHP